MVDYNMTPIDVWGSLRQGMEIGGALRRQARERQYGDAYSQGGWGAVADTAGGAGDLEAAGAAQDRQQGQQASALERAQRNAAVLGNAATSLLGVPYEQRRARIQQMAPMLEGLGLPADQITSFDPTDEALASIRAVQGQFSQYTEIRQQGDAIVGIRPDGSAEVIRQEQPQWQTNGTTPYRVTQDGRVETGQGQIPHVPSSAAMGPQQYQMLSAGEVEAEGLPPGSYQRNTATGQISVVGRNRGQYTEQASNAALYANRMSAAHQTLTQLEDLFTDPTGVFLAQGGMGSENERLVRQAQREFINSILRRESGAAISPTEFNSAQQQYFPQPGDSSAVIEQKRAARMRSIQGLINASQGAYEEWYGPDSGAQSTPSPVPGIVGGAVAGAAFRGPLESLSDEELSALEQQLQNGGR